MNVSVTDLKRRTGRVLQDAGLFGPVTVTYRGKPIAILTRAPRPKPTREEARKHPAFGMWKDREDMKDPVAWVRKQRRARFRFPRQPR